MRIARRAASAGAPPTADECRLTLRVLNGTSSGAHKFKVLGLLFARLAAGNKWQPPGTHVDPAAMFDLTPA